MPLRLSLVHAALPLCAVLCGAAGVVFPTGAAAESGASPATSEYRPTVPPPTGVSAVSQYVESLPGAKGPQAVGTQQPTSQAKLAPKAADAIAKQGGKDATLLEQVATSPYYGAPQKTLQSTPKAQTSRLASRQRSTQRPAGRTGAAVPVSSTGTLTAAAHEVVSGSDGPVLVLWLVVGIATLGAVVVFLRQRHRRQQPDDAPTQTFE